MRHGKTTAAAWMLAALAATARCEPARNAGDDVPGGFLCTDDCALAGNGQCDDGGPGAAHAFCVYGTDCADCGPRTPTACVCDTSSLCQTGCACDPDCGACGCDATPTCDYDCACDPQCPCACDGDWGCSHACACDPECVYGGCNADGACNDHCPAPDPDCPGCACDTSSSCEAGCACDPDCAGCACDTSSSCEAGCACDPDCAGCACDTTAGCDGGCSCDPDCCRDMCTPGQLTCTRPTGLCSGGVVISDTSFKMWVCQVGADGCGCWAERICHVGQSCLPSVLDCVTTSDFVIESVTDLGYEEYRVCIRDRGTTLTYSHEGSPGPSITVQACPAWSESFPDDCLGSPSTYNYDPPPDANPRATVCRDIYASDPDYDRVPFLALMVNPGGASYYETDGSNNFYFYRLR